MCYFQNNKDIQLFQTFQCIQNLLTVTIEISKEQFYSRISNKLMDPTINYKAEGILVNIENIFK